MQKNWQLMAVWVLFLGITISGMATQAIERPAGSESTPTAINQNGEGSRDVTGSGGAPALQRRNPRYRLSAGDVVDLVFPLSPEFNQNATVQPDGYINLLSVGDLHVEGQTAPELTQKLREVYGKILHDPVITVQLKDFEKPYFVAAGEVQHPDKFDLRGVTTAMQGVALAGGFSEYAKHSQVLLFRRVSDDWVEVKKLNLKKMLQAKNLGEDLQLQSGDMLFVPKSLIGKVDRYLPTKSVSLYTRTY